MESTDCPRHCSASVADAGYDTLRNRVLLAAIIGAVRALGPLRRPLAGLVALIWYAKQPARVRRRAADNHRRLTPALNAVQAQARARASYFQYVAMILDGIRVEPLTDTELRGIVDIEGAENVAGRSGIMVTSHFGNWDIGMSTAHALGLPMTTVMAAIGSTTITSLVELSRHRKDFELFSPRQAARGLLRALRGGRWVGLMLDVPEAGPTVVVPFCGGMVKVSAVPARLAAATSVPIVPAACWRVDGRWRVRIHAPIAVTRHDDDASVMAAVARTLEPEIHRHPEQWYPFHEVYEDRPA